MNDPFSYIFKHITDRIDPMINTSIPYEHRQDWLAFNHAVLKNSSNLVVSFNTIVGLTSTDVFLLEASGQPIHFLL